MAYPEYVKIRGEKVKIRTNWTIALRALAVSSDESIGDYERALAIIQIMYGYLPDYEVMPDYINMAIKFLQCGENTETQQEKSADMDLNYDQKYIKASFLSDYHIDLNNCPDMHFWQFCELIGGLTDGCILSRIRIIRTCNVNDYAEKDRPAILRAKKELALPEPKTREQIEFDSICPY